ncbi:ribonuclease HI [Poseidonibacter antarcticus]|uniref:ribonuclease HI n=1 Tax=Poseidonibacter antarcticus TaxID=2478538 RepID=UPI000EF4E991|nr:ribonuclease H [Poseidonibacter antarcticus]
MQITKEFIELISSNDTLNKAQCQILELNFPIEDNWKELIYEKDILKNDANRLMLLKGKLALKAQEQILKNYNMVLEFNNIKPKSNAKVEIQESKNIQETQINDDEEHIRIYCDGACSGNPGLAGSGLAIYSNEKNPVLLHGDFVENGTNNIAELNALYQALTIAKQASSKNIITIYSDSKYSIDCITKWAYGWKNKGWSKKGGEIKNLELIKKTHELYERIKDLIEIKHVKGHAGIEGNELADRMAVTAIKEKTQNYSMYSYDKINEVLSLTSY